MTSLIVIWSRWKAEAAIAPVTPELTKTSSKSTVEPAPPEATTGMVRVVVKFTIKGGIEAVFGPITVHRVNQELPDPQLDDPQGPFVSIEFGVARGANDLAVGTRVVVVIQHGDDALVTKDLGDLGNKVRRHD